MFYNQSVDALSRLKLLSQQMYLEPAEECSLFLQQDAHSLREPSYSPKSRHLEEIFVHAARTPSGRPIKLLKTLLTSACERDCFYCPFRAGRDFRRASFKPNEFAHLFMALHRAGIVEGVFLSSAVAGGGVRTQDQLIETAEILRYRLGFRGYLHLKIMPGAEQAQVERAMQLADRVSINLEAPNEKRLVYLAPHKLFSQELLQPLRWVEEIRRSQPPRFHYKHRWPSSVTQFVAGGAGESDLELLSTTAWLYHELHLTRAYFSPFAPVPDTPLEEQAPTDSRRALRLYQASFLLRDYPFELEDLPFDAQGNLPLEQDAKVVWAERHLRYQPVEINMATREELLRVPGIGPRGAERIIQARQVQTISDLNVLRKLGIQPKRAAPYLLLDGKRPLLQPRLF